MAPCISLLLYGKMAPELRNCLECGAPVSRDADSCPRCKTDNPHGVWCCVCNGSLKASQAVALNRKNIPHGQCVEDLNPIPYRDRAERRALGYHDECYRRALGFPLPERVECGHCHELVEYAVWFELYYAITGHSFSASSSPCPKCGNRKLLEPLKEYCSKCRLPIIRGIHSVYEVDKMQSYESYSTCEYHAGCYPVPSKKDDNITLRYYPAVKPGIWHEQKVVYAASSGCLLLLGIIAGAMLLLLAHPL